MMCLVQQGGRDRLYETARNALIPIAEMIANEKAGMEPKSDNESREAWAKEWTRIFHTEMNRMARERL